MDSVRWIQVGLSTRLGFKTRQPVSPKEGSSLQKPGWERLNQIYVEGRLGRVKKCRWINSVRSIRVGLSASSRVCNALYQEGRIERVENVGESILSDRIG